MGVMIKRNNRRKPMLWKRGSIPSSPQAKASTSKTSQVSTYVSPAKPNYGFSKGTHSLVNSDQNRFLHDYETKTKNSFDNITDVVKQILSQVHRKDFSRWANDQLYSQLGVRLEQDALELNPNTPNQHLFQTLYSKTFFAQFLKLSEDFFLRDPLNGQQRKEAEQKFREAGIHAVGISPCSDGRLAHFVSYVLRLPYTVARRKAHAGGLFDISESVRNWVFVEHGRFRDGLPNSAEEPTRYLKMAVYHYSKAQPTCQGCAAHGSDDDKAGNAALTKLRDFRQAIENRFGANSKVETFLIGINTDDDSLKIHIPDADGRVSLDRFMDTDGMYDATINLPADDAMVAIKDAIDFCNKAKRTSLPRPEIRDLLAWLIANNFSQIEYVHNYEQGCYDDIGHAERFIGIGNGFEEVQLRNLSYYSFLDTVEEGVNDVDVGIKIFKTLNVTRGMPIPVIIRCDYDGRVPGSKDRAQEKALRIEKAIHNRYHELSGCGLLKTMPTLRDKTGYQPAEKLSV
jgi:carboxysome shell carbonic anhydrase